MKVLKFLVLPSLLLLFTVQPAFAQLDPLTLLDITESVNEDEVLAAAQPLVDRGGTVAVFIVSDGDLESYLQEYGAWLEAGAQTEIFPTTLAVFINVETHEAVVDYGRFWHKFERSNIDSIVENTLAPHVNDGNYEAGVVDTLTTIEAYLVDGTYDPATAVTEESGGSGPWWAYVGAFAFALVTVAFVMTVAEVRFYRE